MSLAPLPLPEAEVLSSFTPFTFDASNLQKFLMGVLKKVERCEQENERLNQELLGMKIAQRLDTLEHSVQELADLQMPDSGYGCWEPKSQTSPQQAPAPAAAAHWFQGPDGTAQEQAAAASPDPVTVQHGAYAPERDPAAPAAACDDTSSRAPAPGPGPDAARPGTAQWEGAGGLLAELQSVKGRMSQMERKAEALWHVQESDEEVRGLVQRLKQDMATVQSASGELQGSSHLSEGRVTHLETTLVETNRRLRELQGQVEAVKAQLTKAAEERREIVAKLERNMERVWDDIRVIDDSTNARLLQGEAADAGMLQRLEQRREQGEEVQERVEEMKRHVGALQHKLESFNTQVAAALSPLHSSLGDVKQRMEELGQRKQDVASAVTMNDVNLAATRAMDHADRRTDNTIKSIGALETRVEALNAAKSNKSDVVMTTDLQALLTAHAAELDQHLDALKGEILGTVGLKAQREELLELEGKLGPRISGLEGAILKGLKAVSDKASLALADKLDLSSFVDFQSHVRVVLLDVEQRLKDWSPMARGVKCSQGDDGSAGGGGAASCLCCDSKVRSTKEMQSLGFSSMDKVFSPERLPHMGGLLPSIQRSPDVAAHSSASLVKTRKSLMSLLTTQTPNSAGVAEPLPEASGNVDRVLTGSTSLGSFDPTTLLGVDFKSRLSKRSSGPVMKVEVETITATAVSGGSPKHSFKELTVTPLGQRASP